MNRRSFLRSSLVAGCAALSRRPAFGQAPAIVRPASAVPATPYGVAAGAAGPRRMVVWSRCDRAARMFVDYATTEKFADAVTVRGPATLEGSDFTGQVTLTDLPGGQRFFYRVRFQDLADLRSWSEPVVGSFGTNIDQDAREIRIAWSADTVGQGWGINPEFGGLRLYETMAEEEPHLFVHCGDTIYADGPLFPEVKLSDGTVWRNVVTPAKSKVAEALDDYRGNYQYNLSDRHMRRFNANVAQAALWDDHEVRDNWYPSRDLSHDARYSIKSMALLAARAQQAFLEYNPIPVDGDDPERVYRTIASGPLVEIFALDLRSYRGPNSANRQSAPLDDTTRILGAPQVTWLTGALARSRATWKVIACDMPIGLVVRDGESAYEAIANGDDGPALGRELEIAGVLRFIRANRVRNVVWITGDVHYAAAHHYDPARARVNDFDPFWEFVAGPLHAGTFGPNALDATFGPEVRFSSVRPGAPQNQPPSAGQQFYGVLRILPRTRQLHVSLHDLSGRAIYRVELDAQA